MRSRSRRSLGGKAPVDAIRLRGRILRRFLAANSELMELLADLETDLEYHGPGESQVRQPIFQLLEESLLLVENLNLLTRDRHTALYDGHAAIEKDVRELLRESPSTAALPLLIPLDEASTSRIQEVGGKAARLGGLRAAMPPLVPPGFVISTSAELSFKERNGLHEPIRRLLRDLSYVTERDLFRQRTAAIRSLIEASPVPREVAEAIADGIMRLPTPQPWEWAVRSSAVGEDGRLSFAGQFDSFLNVARDELQDAYRKVIASRYADRAVLYRLAGGLAEVDTPMAVLFLPMLDARSAGVLYTRDPSDVEADVMVVSSVHGLADGLVRGRERADRFTASRSQPGEVIDQDLSGDVSSLSPEDIRTLVETGFAVERHLGEPQDVEWVFARDGRLMVVQSRPLRTPRGRVDSGESVEPRRPLLEGGATVCPGRAVGPAHLAPEPRLLDTTPEGAVLVVEEATPEIGAVVPFLAGLVAERGNCGGHAATLVRECGVPSLFGVDNAIRQLRSGQVLSLDATRGKVFDGALWADVEEHTESRIRRNRSGKPTRPLHERLLALNLTDPLSGSFRASRCRSVHDIIRFAHEKAVAAVFDVGDEAAERGQRVLRLDTEVPLHLSVMDLGGALPATDAPRRSVTPREIDSLPFHALWSGIADPGVSWAGRTRISVAGFASVMVKSMTDPQGSIRQLGERNYVMVSPEYLNLNARLAYHFAMVDAFVSDVPDSNYVSFRFRGGGASADRKDLRARFLTEVLRHSQFGVDRRGDLVTAWLRRRSKRESQEQLALLGRLMACARQLDMLMDNETALRHFVRKFLDGNYEEFA
jgi:pyruvate,water dikinase